MNTDGNLKIVNLNEKKMIEIGFRSLWDFVLVVRSRGRPVVSFRLRSDLNAFIMIH